MSDNAFGAVLVICVCLFVSTCAITSAYRDVHMNQPKCQEPAK